MKTKTIFVSLFFGFLSVAGISGLSLEDLISPEQIAALTTVEKSVLVQFNNPQPQLTPRHEIFERLIEPVRRNLEPGVMVEALYLYQKPEDAEKTRWSAAEEAALFNEVSALSTLAGIQYFSISRGTMRTLFETSQIIDSPSTKKPLPDPVHPHPPTNLTVYARMKDTTFGDNIYQFDFYSAPEALIFTQENLTTLTVGIFPAIRKNKFHSIAAVLDAGEYLLIYGISMVKVTTLPGMKERIGNSFSNRVEAILHWFSAQADKAFGKTHGGR